MALHCVNCQAAFEDKQPQDVATFMCEGCSANGVFGANVSTSSWDQRKTLRPPPFKGAMKRLLAGLEIGDDRVDALPLSAVCCHGGEARKIGLEPHPAWVNWDQVRRGQKVFLKHLGQSYLALSLALLQGFSIARFAEVLNHNGYAQSAETAFERYRETAFAIVDWMSYPLDEENSKSQLQIQNVRAMHSFARRRSMKLFDRSKGEGIALSQYDMAEVQLAFAGIAPSILANEMGVKLPAQDLEDWCHAWRLIGFHLGIRDEFNACNSVEDMHALMDDWFGWTPTRFTTCRPATFALQRTALEGFGRFTAIGVEFFSGMLHATCSTRDWDVDYLERPCDPGMKILGRWVLHAVGNPIVNRLLGLNIIRMRHMWLEYPGHQKKLMPFLSAISRLNDAVLWKIVGFITLNAKLFFASQLRTVAFGYISGVTIAHFAVYKLLWAQIIRRIISLVTPKSVLA